MSTGTLTVDLDAVAANWRALDALSAATCETAATIKADAYGLGAGPVARALAQAGARTFAVAFAEEGAALRDALGPGPAIMVYAGHMAGDTDMIGDLGLTPMLNSIEQVTRHVEALPGHPFGIQLDSGMNRLGMEPEEWAAVREIALRLNPVLIMSHLACADEPDHPMNDQQLQQFVEMSEATGVPLFARRHRRRDAGQGLSFRHDASRGGALRRPALRCGTTRGAAVAAGDPDP